MASLAIDQYYQPPRARDRMRNELLTDVQFGAEGEARAPIGTGLRAGLKIYSSTGTLPVPIAEVLDRLRELETYERGWDSYGGRPLNNHVVEPALSLILDGWKTCNHPRIHLNSQGGIDLFWDSADRSLEISIAPSRRCSVYFEDTASDQVVAPEEPVAVEEARTLLRRFCGQ
jgi:hypothetical protein